MSHSPESTVLGRRAFLRTASATGVAAALGAQSTTSAMVSAAPELLRSSCVLTAPQPSGPFYQSLGLLRRDITEGQLGVALTLLFRVLRASDCSPVAGAFVDVWHNNAAGTYSGFAVEGTAGETWLRGAQQTDAGGFAWIQTIYPGWYTGRTCHLHAKVFTPPDVFTTQFYVPDAFSARIWKDAPYSGPNPLLNVDDAGYDPNNVLALRPLGLGVMPGMPGGIRHVLAGKTIVLA